LGDPALGLEELEELAAPLEAAGGSVVVTPMVGAFGLVAAAETVEALACE